VSAAHEVIPVCEAHGRLFCDHRAHRWERLRGVAAAIVLAGLIGWTIAATAFWWVTRP
jgi:hypothetical protein